MRYIKIAALLFLALVLVGVALANRQPVALSATPAGLDPWLGSTTIMVPLYLVILISLLVGIVIGLVYEWLREAHIRREAARRAREVAVLEREVTHRAPPRDDVLALVDRPVQRPVAEQFPAATAAAQAQAGLPAPAADRLPAR
ncbi:DUF1049 domain-containing protein [Paracoccus sp. S-4012]|uniref:lipopolysaccharide assembly protein LapA domain-containing protein n=1 Tax=Paracoccus sp. S-4012 TaxID=2665648 RepID=UPI0012B0D315|nr:lipopolysaccharide assembly protein LapA domain-containing protein [Paracoccus sp. S-4012]MRX50269.1 DUF1049 domain-containing protein [Paracoccus sp. S-4012]